MPHLATNRPRFYTTVLKDDEFFNVSCYLCGGALFIPGSVFFLPEYFKAYPRIGPTLFVIGSVLYVLVTAQDLLEATAHWQQALHMTADGHRMTVKEMRKVHVLRQQKWKLIEWIVATLYVIGSAVFVVGSVFFLPEPYNVAPYAGTWMFVLGSVLFMGGAIINMLQLYTVTSPLTVQLLNATAVQFLVGSVLFLVGSTVYLLNWGSPEAWEVANTFAAWLFIFGSFLFTTGGFSNFVRIWKSRSFHDQKGRTAVMTSQKTFTVHDRKTGKHICSSDSEPRPDQPTAAKHVASHI